MTVDNCKKKSKEFDVQQIKENVNIDWMAIKTVMTITVTTMVIILAADQLFALLDPPLLCTGKLPQVLPGNLHRLENRYSLLYLLPLLIF